MYICIYALLSLDFRVILNTDMLVRLQSMDLIRREFGTVLVVSGLSEIQTWSTYVKPLISLNSLTILPP